MENEISERHCRSLYGISIKTINFTLEILNTLDTNIQLQHLQWSLFFLRNYPTQDQLELKFNKDHKTLSKWIWKVIDLINIAGGEYEIINFGNRLANTQHHSQIKTAIDGTECPIARPLNNDIQKKYYSGKKKKHMIKYVVLADILSGEILFISGSYCGSQHDLTIARKSGIMDMLQPNELIMGDKAYIGAENIICPIKVPINNLEKEWNSIINTHRVIVENTFGRVKNWKCLKIDWRHDLHYHRPAFFAVCILINLDLFEHPIRRHYSV